MTTRDWCIPFPLFSKQGYEVQSSNSGSKALEMASEQSFDLILLDYKMPGMTGLDTLRQIRQAQVKTPSSS